MSVVEVVREKNQEWSSDDPRWWAQLLGVLLVVGLTIRGGIHVWTALAWNGYHDDSDGEMIDPHLADTDITVKSPVMGLRGHPADRVARYVTFVAGLGVWGLFSLEGRPLVGQAVIVSTVAVCLSDPVLFVVDRVRDR